MRKSDFFFVPGLLCLTLSFGSQPAQAAAGNLDPTFGTGGVTITNVAGSVELVNSVLLQNDGKILVLVTGGSKNQVLRYTTSGALDASFGSNGVVVLPTTATATLALQSNGQIVIGGAITIPSGGTGLGAARLNANGSLDTSFGTNGLAIASLGSRAPLEGTAVLVEPNGDILVGAQLSPAGRRQSAQTALARFNSVGALDSTFGTQGLAIATGAFGCSALALLSSGEILVVNAQQIAQFSANGTAESTVTGGTIVASTQNSSPLLPSIFEPNGDYLFGTQLFVGEESRGHNSSAQVLRFTETGSADPSFPNPAFHFEGAGGSGIEAFVNGMAVQPNGDIVVVGNQTTFTQSGTTTVNGIARLTPNGALDSTFGNGGTIANSIPAGTQELSGVVIQSDGKIVTVGIANNYTSLTLVRYLGE